MKSTIGSGIDTTMIAAAISLRRAIRFAVAGIFITALHIFIAVTFIKYVLPIPHLANGIAFTFATIASYLINTIWSFEARLRGRTLFRFFTVSTIGFLLAMVVAWTAQHFGFHYLTGIGAVALMIPLLTFILHNFWTYR